MKALTLLFIIFSFFIFNSCSVQEKVTPIIFMQRLNETVDEIEIDYQNSYYEGNTFIVFADYINNEIVIKLDTNQNNVLSKISLYSDNKDKTNGLINILISLYSPNEDIIKITDDLSDNNNMLNYSYGKEYTYSMLKSENSIYFEIFNNYLSDYTIPELTLKPNDKTEF